MMMPSQVPSPDTPVPAAVVRLLGAGVEPLWRNQLGGLTFASATTVVKWNPHGNPIDLRREAGRLAWAAGRIPVPRLLDVGEDADGQWLATQRTPTVANAVVPGADPYASARAIAAGLRALHALPVDDCPFEWRAQDRGGVDVPPIDALVVCHGDACAPNTLMDARGGFAALVDLGSLGLADRWADLAVASMSLDWNFGEGHQDEFFAAYGIERDEKRIAYYRALWDLES
jgi:kanamycin kinase